MSSLSGILAYKDGPSLHEINKNFAQTRSVNDLDIFEMRITVNPAMPHSVLSLLYELIFCFFQGTNRNYFGVSWDCDQ